jgi:hypothetical protein
LPEKHQVFLVGSRGLICRINLDIKSDEISQGFTINSTDIFSMDTVRYSRPDIFDRHFKYFNGNAYKLNPLGEGYSGKIDQDPRFNTDQFDCQTAIEHALAFAIVDQPPDQLIPVMDHIRYEAGKVAFWTRNHFFVPDWIPYNSWIIEDITTSLAGTLAIKLTRVIGRQKFFGYYDIKNPHLKDEKMSTYVIPMKHILLLKDKIENGMIVAFIGKRKKDDWLFTIHTGSLSRQGENIFLRHASSTAKKVVEEDFFDYLDRGKNRILGVKLLKIVD